MRMRLIVLHRRYAEVRQDHARDLAAVIGQVEYSVVSQHGFTRLAASGDCMGGDCIGDDCMGPRARSYGCGVAVPAVASRWVSTAARANRAAAST